MKLSLLVSGSKAIYTGQFQVSGMRNKVVLSEPNYYTLLDRLTQLTVEKVSPQLYTGTEVKPPVSMDFGRPVFKRRRSLPGKIST